MIAVNGDEKVDLEDTRVTLPERFQLVTHLS